MGQASFPVAGPFAAWANFYVIVGSSAGALTGLQFVVMTLITQTRKTASAQDIRAFGTPTVVHFCAALLFAAVMTAPWPSVFHVQIAMAVCGGLGIAYALRVLWHAWKANYNPDVEDWIWYGALPIIAYAAFGAAAMVLWHGPTVSMFVVAAATLLLLIIGIHNAWDTVTYLAVRGHPGAETREPDR